jgi:MFS family permease
MELEVLPEANTVCSVVDKPSDAQADSTQRSVTADLDEYPTGFKLIIITVGLVLSIFLSALDSTIIVTAIPSITDEFGTIRNIAWYGSAYQVTNTAFQLTWGKVYTHFSLKRVFLLAIAEFELGNVVCAAAPNSSIVILGRVIAGV